MHGPGQRRRRSSANSRETWPLIFAEKPKWCAGFSAGGAGMAAGVQPSTSFARAVAYASPKCRLALASQRPPVDGPGEFMFRRAIRLIGLAGMSTIIACSEDDSTSESAGGASLGGGAGRSGAGGGAGGAAMYTVAQTCEMFAAVTCAKAAECGLVLDETDAGLVCIECNAAALDIIATGCAGDLEGPKDVAALDRCLANLAAASCMDACADEAVEGCDVIEELSGDDEGEPVVCDPACVSE
jgi:hypothetical protein